MVANVQQTLIGANVVGLARRPEIEPGAARTAEPTRAAPRDETAAPSPGGAALSARDAVLSALASLDLALGAGREAQAALTDLREARRTGGDVRAAFERFAEAVRAGGPLLAGETLLVRADPESAPLTIEGVDLASELAAPPEAPDTLAAALDAAMARIAASARKLDLHADMLGALETAVSASVRGDLDSDAARLTALQVRQQLSGLETPILSSAPASILAHFRG